MPECKPFPFIWTASEEIGTRCSRIAMRTKTQKKTTALTTTTEQQSRKMKKRFVLHVIMCMCENDIIRQLLLANANDANAELLIRFDSTICPVEWFAFGPWRSAHSVRAHSFMHTADTSPICLAGTYQAITCGRTRRDVKFDKFIKLDLLNDN